MSLDALDVRASLSLSISGQLTKDFGNLAQQIAESLATILAVGTGADKANKCFADQRTLGAGGNETLELQDGTLNDQFGQAVTFSKLRGIYVRNRSLTGTLQVGGAANPIVGWVVDGTDKIALGPATATNPSVLLLLNPSAAGYTVGAGLELKMTNTDGGATLIYDLILFGE